MSFPCDYNPLVTGVPDPFGLRFPYPVGPVVPGMSGQSLPIVAVCVKILKFSFFLFHPYKNLAILIGMTFNTPAPHCYFTFICSHFN